MASIRCPFTQYCFIEFFLSMKHCFTLKNEAGFVHTKLIPHLNELEYHEVLKDKYIFKRFIRGVHVELRKTLGL